MKKTSIKLIRLIIIIGTTIFIILSCKKDDSSTKIEPVISWENPSDVKLGHYLSSDELNAKTNINGVMNYEPGEGTLLLEVGNQILNVTFTPTDSLNYNKVSKSVTINVTTPDEIVFNENLSYGSITDQDGNTYKTITIGTQTWMAENLRTTKYQNGETIPNISNAEEWESLSTGAYCFYYNTAEFSSVFGNLYNYYAVIDSRNIAPSGWHVATDDDFKTLEKYLGMSQESVDSLGSRGSNEAFKLREIGNLHWLNDQGLNDFGFCAIAAGQRLDNGTFYDKDILCSFWTSTSQYYRKIFYTDSQIDRASMREGMGYSVRCVKD